MTVIPILLCGGSGTRLYPLSSDNHPKQFLSLISEKTMLQETFLRLKGLNISSPIVVCKEEDRFTVTDQFAELDEKKITLILEPCSKNTAPAIAVACRKALDIDKESICVVLPCDHYIKDVGSFQNAIKFAIKEAINENLVIFGVKPTKPSSNYGYIKCGKKTNDSFELESFVEKPNHELAEKYLESGKYLWNSGMFVFKAKTFLSELNNFENDMYFYSVRAYEIATYKTYQNWTCFADFIYLDKTSYEKIKGNSIDYTVMEKTSNGKIIKLDIGWNDVGSWDALWEIKDKDKNDNVILGNVKSLDTKSSLLYSKKRQIISIGVENIVLIDTDDCILVSTMDKVQNIKKLLN